MTVSVACGGPLAAAFEGGGASGGGDLLTVSRPISWTASLGRGRQEVDGEVGTLRQVGGPDSFGLAGRVRGGVVGKLTTGDKGVLSPGVLRTNLTRGIDTKYFGCPWIMRGLLITMSFTVVSRRSSTSNEKTCNLMKRWPRGQVASILGAGGMGREL